MNQKKIEPFKLSMKDVEESTGESTSTIYKAIAAGHLATFLVGRRRFARPEAVKTWIDYLQAESDAGRPVKYQGRETASA